VIGKELKVSELNSRMIVCLWKQSKANVMVTMWVKDVGAGFVHFWAGEANTHFIATRCGPGLEQITDDSEIPMKIYEYLGDE
jgi:hypothetical protein